MGLCGGFAQCLLAAVPHGCSFPEAPPEGNDHVGSGAEQDVPDSASERDTNASSKQSRLNINIYNAFDSSRLQDAWKGNWLSSHFLSETQVLSSMHKHS